MTWKDKLELGLKNDAAFRKDNLPPNQVRGPELPSGPGRSPEIPMARDDRNEVAAPSDDVESDADSSANPPVEAPETGQPQEGAPAAIPRTRRYDLTSKINGRTYRVFVSTPSKADPGKADPVVYILDGNWYFAAASINVDESARGGHSRAIVVGIGYPTDDNDVVSTRRAFELTMSAAPTDKEPGLHGGGDAFLRVLEEEVKPFVAARYKIDPARQILYGKSLGGLMVLRQLLRHPEAYSTYIAASPSIWWNDREVLADEGTFAKRAKAGELSVRLLLTSAGDEHYRGDDPKLRAADSRRMIDNVSELASRLAPLNPEKVTVTRVIFPEETHVSVSLASLGRALTFALKP